MNKRIRELAKQAEALVESMPIEERWDWLNLYDQIFAELIIEECVEICLVHRVRNNDYNQGRTECASDIKEHFGVE